MMNSRNKRDRDNNNTHSNIVPNSILFNKKSAVKKAPKCPLSLKDAPEVDYKNIELLLKYISEKGRILPRRITGLSAKKQRQIKRSIKNARALALLPFQAM
jgi:small subunit ribosomal protein S18